LPSSAMSFTLFACYPSYLLSHLIDVIRCYTTCRDILISSENIISRNRIPFRAQISTVSGSANKRSVVPTSIYHTFVRCHTQSYTCVTSLSNCGIWLQLKPNYRRQFNFTRRLSSKFEGIPFNFIVKLNRPTQIAKIECYLIAKTA